MVVVAPFALTNEFTVAELVVMDVAAWVWTIGAATAVAPARQKSPTTRTAK